MKEPSILNEPTGFYVRAKLFDTPKTLKGPTENDMTDTLSLAIIFAAFFAGGSVKGLAGMGLPAITVALLTFAFGLPAAMALMAAPGIVTNLFQAVNGGHMASAFKKIAPFLIPSLFTIWYGTGLLVSLDNSWLIIVLGAILAVYATVALTGYSLQISKRRQTWLGPAVGVINGITTGMTGVVSTPSVIYINGIGMERDKMIQAMGQVFLISYLVLVIALWFRGVLTPQSGLLSLYAVFPALLGMWVGQSLQKRLPERLFKKVFYYLLLAIGLYLMVRGLTS